MDRTYSIRRSLAVTIALILVGVGIFMNPDFYHTRAPEQARSSDSTLPLAFGALEELEVKGRAPKTGYTRAQFGGGWISSAGCDMRNLVLARDLENTVLNESCQVLSGVLHDPYTAKVVHFQRGSSTSQAVQIDHVVALSDAWQKGAQQLSYERRVSLSNDPLNLLAVDGGANQQKGDGDAATWLPPNRSFRCQYVARQIAVKKKYDLWVTRAEKNAVMRVLGLCPGQRLPAMQ